MFVDAVNVEIAEMQWQVYFRGSSNGDAPWQNYCWVCDAYSGDIARTRLSRLAKEFKQEAIALTIGATSFIKP